MAVYVNTNYSALQGQRNLSNVQNQLTTTYPVSYTHLTLPTT